VPDGKTGETLPAASCGQQGLAWPMVSVLKLLGIVSLP
jgi:hypothetical protein